MSWAEEDNPIYSHFHVDTKLTSKKEKNSSGSQSLSGCWEGGLGQDVKEHRNAVGRKQNFG